MVRLQKCIVQLKRSFDYKSYCYERKSGKTIYRKHTLLCEALQRAWHESTMLSIKECKRTLEKYGEKYTDQQVKEIRDLLYTFANIDRINREAECKAIINQKILNDAADS